MKYQEKILRGKKKKSWYRATCQDHTFVAQHNKFGTFQVLTSPTQPYSPEPEP